jgi:hypothetical protein
VIGWVLCELPVRRRGNPGLGTCGRGIRAIPWKAARAANRQNEYIPNRAAPPLRPNMLTRFNAMWSEVIARRSELGLHADL